MIQKIEMAVKNILTWDRSAKQCINKHFFPGYKFRKTGGLSENQIPMQGWTNLTAGQIVFLCPNQIVFVSKSFPLSPLVRLFSQVNNGHGAAINSVFVKSPFVTWSSGALKNVHTHATLYLFVFVCICLYLSVFVKSPFVTWSSGG